MTRLPHVTVLMGTRNGGAYLRQQLASLAAQDHAQWSLWISDDGSTDDTHAVIRAFAGTRPNPVVLLAGPQAGLSANYLSLLCHPDLPDGPVAFADQDDLWLPTHLSRGLMALTQSPAPQGQAYTAHRLVLRSGQVVRPLPRRQTQPASFRNALVESLLAGSGLMLDAPAVACARAIGPVNVPFWDWWLYLLLTGSGVDILQDAAPGVIYRAHGGNTLGPRQGLHARLRRLRHLGNGTYRAWAEANFAALEPHICKLRPDAQTILRHVQRLPARTRLRHLSGYRQWPQDRLAMWLAA